MRESLPRRIVQSTDKRGIELHAGATDCTGIHVRVARAIWPKKTAENWAARAGVKPRMAKYWISRGKVSDSGKLALMRLLD